MTILDNKKPRIQIGGGGGADDSPPRAVSVFAPGCSHRTGGGVDGWVRRIGLRPDGTVHLLLHPLLLVAEVFRPRVGRACIEWDCRTQQYGNGQQSFHDLSPSLGYGGIVPIHII